MSIEPSDSAPADRAAETGPLGGPGNQPDRRRKVLHGEDLVGFLRFPTSEQVRRA